MRSKASSWLVQWGGDSPLWLFSLQMVSRRERADGFHTYFPADKRKLKCRHCSNRESQRLERDSIAVIGICPESLLGVSLMEMHFFFSSSQWVFYCHRVFPASPGPPLYPDFFTKLLSVHLAVDHGVNVYRDVNEVVGRPAWCHLLVAWLPKMAARSSGLFPLGAVKHWYMLKCCPVTFLNADALFAITQTSQEAVLVKNSERTALVNKWLLWVKIRDLNTSVCVGFSFPGP